MAHRRTVLVVAVSLTVSALVSLGPALASPSPTTADADRISVDTKVDGQGRVRAVTLHSPRSAASVRPAGNPGEVHVPQVSQWFGMTVGSLDVAQVRTLPAGSTVKLHQRVNGVPVFGGEVVQTLDRSGALLAAQGRTTGRASGSFPADRAASDARARAVALHEVSVGGGGQTGDLRADEPSRYWFDPTLLGMPGNAGAVPAVLVPIRGRQAHQRWTVVVDAVRESVLTSWPEENEDTSRVVCDAANGGFDTGVDANFRCGTAVAATRVEGGAASGVTDVDDVYRRIGFTADFYRKYTNTDLTSFIGYDAGDGRGKQLLATVRLCDTSCPMTNAFWNGEQITLGTGYTVDDVVGHELTHGVTAKTSKLVYRGESGAINEAISDIFGEFVQFTQDPSSVTPQNRWLHRDGYSGGPNRSLADPPQYQQPDRKGGQYWYSGDADNGGVHANSGVANKADFLITDGGTFNGQSITGLGMDKSIALWWTVQNTLTSTSTYKDLATALGTACQQNAAAGVAGTTQADCTEVGKVVTATLMDS